MVFHAHSTARLYQGETSSNLNKYFSDSRIERPFCTVQDDDDEEEEESKEEKEAEEEEEEDDDDDDDDDNVLFYVLFLQIRTHEPLQSKELKHS